jgi:hypothetical protein
MIIEGKTKDELKRCLAKTSDWLRNHWLTEFMNQWAGESVNRWTSQLLISCGAAEFRLVTIYILEKLVPHIIERLVPHIYCQLKCQLSAISMFAIQDSLPFDHCGIGAYGMASFILNSAWLANMILAQSTWPELTARNHSLFKGTRPFFYS